MKRRYLIVVEGGQQGDDYSAYSHDVEGCVAAGDTLGQTIDLMQEALELHLEDILLQGEGISESSHGIAIHVNVSVPNLACPRP